MGTTENRIYTLVVHDFTEGKVETQSSNSAEYLWEFALNDLRKRFPEYTDEMLVKSERLEALHLESANLDINYDIFLTTFTNVLGE